MNNLYSSLPCPSSIHATCTKTSLCNRACAGSKSQLFILARDFETQVTASLTFFSNKP